jgi:V/A-type H+-transporting ATPase subunit F
VQYKIAIVGPKEEILCFRAVGADIHPVNNAEQATKTLFELKKAKVDASSDTSVNKYAIILVMEELLKEINAEDLTKLSQGALPAIIGLPGHRGATGFGASKIASLVEKAVGSDIFSN